jgi:hypothetical protein
MPSYGVDDLLRTLARPSSQPTPAAEVCAGGVSKHQKATCAFQLPSCFLLYQNFARVAESG